MGGAQSITTHLEIKNETNRDFSISVSEIDNYDWDGNYRPDHNFHNVTIKRKSSVIYREDINANANYSPFRMTLHFSDGSSDSFRIHQRHAVDCCASFQHFQKSHRISYRTSERTLIITVENTWEQLQNERAEVLNEQGERELKLKLFGAAVSKFEEAQKLANEASTVSKVRGNLKEAKVLGLNEEGLVLQQEKKYEEAIEKFNQALNLATDGFSINNIKANKAESLMLFGESLYEEAWSLENDQNEDRSTEAAAKFQRSKTIFKNSGQTQRLKLVELKISGNQLYNQAFEEEKRALEMFEDVKKSQSGDFAQVKSKYKKVLAMYRNAAKKFDEGSGHDSKFLGSANFVREQIVGVQTVIEDLNREELAFNLKKVRIDVEAKANRGQGGDHVDEEKLVSTDVTLLG